MFDHLICILVTHPVAKPCMVFCRSEEDLRERLMGRPHGLSASDCDALLQGYSVQHPQDRRSYTQAYINPTYRSPTRTQH